MSDQFLVIDNTRTTSRGSVIVNTPSPTGYIVNTETAGPGIASGDLPDYSGTADWYLYYTHPSGNPNV